MSLAEAARREPEKPRRPSFPETLAHRLPPEEFEGLMALLDNPAWSAEAIIRELKASHDIEVSASTVKKYRRGRLT
ncbi:hypothetical protein [Puerhibacterium puerhi]|uniref:hypothetical protein n=1 Tax=Puerhibacterium puerhi TaxID=2692623 RepID=UPI001359F081|nr:hypothetical protein [Puerhibacterium puerhi]